MSASPDPDPAAADGGAPPLDDDANVQTSDATAGTQLVAHGDAQAIAESMAEASPKEIDIPMANVDKGINGIARYIVVVITGDGRRWAISKRFSDFYDLKMELAMLETHLKNGMLVRDLAFPPKQLWGGSGDEVISTRIPALRRWVNNVLKLAPESRDFEALMSMFLAEDHSVDQRTLRLIGLNEDRLMSTGRASAGAAPRQLVRPPSSSSLDSLARCRSAPLTCGCQTCAPGANRVRERRVRCAESPGQVALHHAAGALQLRRRSQSGWPGDRSAR